MKVEYKHKSLEKLALDSSQSGRWPEALIRTYQRRILVIRSALDRRDLYALSSLHLEKLKGKRKHQFSIKLDNQFRIILEFRKVEKKEVVDIIAIEDYHK